MSRTEKVSENLKETNSYQDLKIWQFGRALVKSSYTMSSKFPKEEANGLVTQVRRAAISIPSNIAEGYARNSKKDFYSFLSAAGGALSDLETKFILANDLSFISEFDSRKILKEIGMLQKMLWNFRDQFKVKLTSVNS